MYSVIRFKAGKASIEELESIGNLLNVRIPETFKRLDRIGGRFSLTLSQADDWADHEAAALAFVQTAGDAIDEAQKRRCIVEIDVAIEPEDLQGKPYLTFSMSEPFQSQMLNAHIFTVFTFYGGPPAGQGTSESS